MNEESGMEAIGDTYIKGHGVEINYDSAIHWYRKAAEFGSESACEKLAKIYSEGKFVTKNLSKAKAFREEAQRIRKYNGKIKKD